LPDVTVCLLEAALARRGWSCHRLAQEVKQPGLSVRTTYAIFQGETVPTIRQADALAEALKMSDNERLALLRSARILTPDPDPDDRQETP
jgi:ribosome-binding protein aMBF1 (putative translation factor)